MGRCPGCLIDPSGIKGRACRARSWDASHHVHILSGGLVSTPFQGWVSEPCPVDPGVAQAAMDRPFGLANIRTAGAGRWWRGAQLRDPQTRLKSGGARHSQKAWRGDRFRLSMFGPFAWKMAFVGGHGHANIVRFEFHRFRGRLWNAAKIRAWWSHRQALDGRLADATLRSALEQTGWARSVGGTGRIWSTCALRRGP